MNRLLFIIKFILDKIIPFKEKLWVIIPLMYILSPVDLIPVPVFGFSVVDDLIMFVFLLTKVYEKTRNYYKENYKEKDIIEDVEYEIKDKEE